MALFEWSGDYETGVREIDDQHRALVRLINELDETRSGGSTGSDALQVFDRLGDYIRYHFNAEERALVERGLPEEALRAHKAQHDQFVHRVHRLGSLQRMRSFAASDELMDFLVSWLTDHILRRDRRDLAIVSPAAEVGFGRDDGTPEAALRAALAEATIRFQHLADGIPLLLWSSDEHGVRTWFNRTATEFVARDGALTDEAWSAAVHPDDRERALRELQETVASPQLLRRELRLRERAGGYRHVLETLLPRYENHTRFVGLLGCGVDITQQRLGIQVLHDARALLEEAVATRTAELESANESLRAEHERQNELVSALSAARAQTVEAHGHAALRTFAAGLAHEMNTPLAVAIANVSHLEESLTSAAPATELGDDLPELLADTRRGLAQIARIVAALASYVGAATVGEDCDLNGVVTATSDLLRSQLPQGLSLVLDLGTVPNPACTPQSLLTALTHLLLNAGQAAGSTGQVTVRTWAEGDSVLLAVSDTGTGIAPEHLPQVFDAFFTTREIGQGLGLGLTVARNLIEKAGGTLTVESTLGVGSTFTIRLARAR